VQSQELAALADVMAKNEITPERPLLDSWLAAVKQAVAAEAQEEGVAPDAYILPALVSAV
jgi:predicted alpha/beta hydrolase family esterase